MAAITPKEKDGKIIAYKFRVKTDLRQMQEATGKLAAAFNL